MRATKIGLENRVSTRHIEDEDHVLHYCNPERTSVREGRKWPRIEELRPKRDSGHTGLSVNWIEFFKEEDPVVALYRAKEAYELTLNPNGLLVRWTVGEIRHDDLLSGTVEVVHKPRPKNPSHSDIEGFTEANATMISMALWKLLKKDEDVLTVRDVVH